ncbi:MAG: pantetheine-phosphate adenylyltransferase [Bacteroidales bacterium]|nr:pantetheine-phosphate adenylyltransferase [Bacteroidales bacterium]MCF8332635.1 pantetheine-phosphate adenylyltransferase [Bacteroidales bacterium]
MKIAVFPGSFDPITIGHESIIRRALPLFDKIIVAIGENSEKKNLFCLEKRIEWLNKTFSGIDQIEVDSFQGLTVDYCRSVNARYILRGLRTSADFEFERSVGQVNKQMYNEVETIFMLTTPEQTAVNSSVVRDIFKHGGDIRPFIPSAIDIRKHDQG